MKFYLAKLFALIDMRSAACFVSVGALSAVIYFGSFTLLWRYFGLDYNVAISIGYVLSVIVHFTVNRRVTFRSHGHQLFYQLIKYLVMITFNYGITLLVVHFVVKVLDLSPYLGVVCSIGATVGISYLLAKLWVFRLPVNT